MLVGRHADERGAQQQPRARDRTAAHSARRPCGAARRRAPRAPVRRDRQRRAEPSAVRRPPAPARLRARRCSCGAPRAARRAVERALQRVRSTGRRSPTVRRRCNAEPWRIALDEPEQLLMCVSGPSSPTRGIASSRSGRFAASLTRRRVSREDGDRARRRRSRAAGRERRSRSPTRRARAARAASDRRARRSRPRHRARAGAPRPRARRRSPPSACAARPMPRPARRRPRGAGAPCDRACRSRSAAIASSHTNADGTMKSGSVALSARRSAAGVWPLRPRRARDAVRDEPLVAGRILAHERHGGLHPGCRTSAVSISPSSTRKPRSFTWLSMRPRYSSVPSARQRARSPVRYSRAPRSSQRTGRARTSRPSARGDSR